MGCKISKSGMQNQLKISSVDFCSMICLLTIQGEYRQESQTDSLLLLVVYKPILGWSAKGQ